MSLWNETWVKNALKAADKAAQVGDPSAITDALRVLPMEFFIKTYFDEEMADYPSLSNWLPDLPPEEDQRAWAGNVGVFLMQQGGAFVERMFDIYQRTGPLDPATMRVLDYGCGWGRLVRLLYKYVCADNIYGLDPWPPSLERCEAYNVHGKFGLSDYIPTSLPVAGPFDIIFAYSVFTHITDRSHKAVLKQWREVIAPDGLVALTIRQSNYWETTPWPDEQKRLELKKAHLENGYAFIRHSEEDSERARDYGDTSITLEYIDANWTDWEIVDVDWKFVDEFQTYVFLQPK